MNIDHIIIAVLLATYAAMLVRYVKPTLGSAEFRNIIAGPKFRGVILEGRISVYVLLGVVVLLGPILIGLLRVAIRLVEED